MGTGTDGARMAMSDQERRRRNRERARRWRELHPEESREQAKAWRARNPERAAESNRESQKRRRRRDPEKVRAEERARRAQNPAPYRERAKRKREGQLEADRTAKRQWYYDKREHVLAQRKAWRAANPEEDGRRKKEWAQNNREKLRKWGQRYEKRCVGKMRAKRLRYLARKLGAFIEDVEHEIVYGIGGGRCGICHEFIEGDFHVDHIIPLSRGGKHGYINVQPAHPFCNTSKSDRLQEELPPPHEVAARRHLRLGTRSDPTIVVAA